MRIPGCVCGWVATGICIDQEDRDVGGSCSGTRGTRAGTRELRAAWTGSSRILIVEAIFARFMCCWTVICFPKLPRSDRSHREKLGIA